MSVMFEYHERLPLVTIYVPTYNRLPLLKRAINSVLAQKYENIELIVVDDCSTDGTIDYLKSLSSEDRRIKAIFKEKNSGACVSRNLAIKNANGIFITGLDDDDFFLEERISKFVASADLLNDYQFLYSSYLYEKKGRLSRIFLDTVRIPGELKFSDILGINFVGNQVFTYTSRLREVNGFDENLKAWQDLELWLALLNNGRASKYVENKSYVVNRDDNPSRITSNNRGDKIRRSFSYISEKYALDEAKQAILSLQMMPYGVDVPLKNYICLLKENKNFGVIFNLLSLVKFKIKTIIQ